AVRHVHHLDGTEELKLVRGQLRRRAHSLRSERHLAGISACVVEQLADGLRGKLFAHHQRVRDFREQRDGNEVFWLERKVAVEQIDEGYRRGRADRKSVV